jgi:cyclase
MGWKVLKKRIIPIQLLSGSRLVKTTRFATPRDVGDPLMSSKVYSDQDADELILLSIGRLDESFDTLVSTVEKIAKECFVPLSVGGGISSVSHARQLFSAGADKIIINSITYDNPKLITEIASLAGTQAVVVGIDAQLIDAKYILRSHGARIAQTVSLSDHMSQIIALGAGEIMIQSIDNDGAMQGYDINLIKKVIYQSTVPVIAAGGAGVFAHLNEAFEVGASAVACGSLFNFGDNNPLRAKAFLSNLGVPLKRIK